METKSFTAILKEHFRIFHKISLVTFPKPWLFIVLGRVGKGLGLRGTPGLWAQGSTFRDYGSQLRSPPPTANAFVSACNIAPESSR